jgi:rare lipoprotein A (peptidoglycan hydrolase)
MSAKRKIRVPAAATVVTGTLLLLLPAILLLCGGGPADAQPSADTGHKAAVHHHSRHSHRRRHQGEHTNGVFFRVPKPKHAAPKHAAPKHRARRKHAHTAAVVHLSPTVASWYYDEGNTACGFHAEYGIANKTLPCGTKVTLSYGGHTVVATVDDRGPYVYGRSYDLDQNTAAALGMSGVVTVYASIV